MGWKLEASTPPVSERRLAADAWCSPVRRDSRATTGAPPGHLGDIAVHAVVAVDDELVKLAVDGLAITGCFCHAALLRVTITSVPGEAAGLPAKADPGGVALDRTSFLEDDNLNAVEAVRLAAVVTPHGAVTVGANPVGRFGGHLSPFKERETLGSPG